MSGALYLHRFDCDETGEELKVSDEGELADAVIELGGLKTGEGLAITDMDNTMFRDDKSRNVIGDLGVLVFLEKLGDPHFWHFSPESFRKLLLPVKYRRFAIEHSNGQGKHDVNKDACQKILNLVEDLVELYSILKKVTFNMSPGVPLNFNHPVVNEFALKMLHFDNVVKVIESKMFNEGLAPLLMRVRFFAGSDKAKARNLTAQVMMRESDDADAHIALASNPGVAKVAKDFTLPYENRVDAGKLDFLRVVEINEGVRRLIARLSGEMQIPVHVVSANLREIAKAAVDFSPYESHIHGIYASVLETDKDRIGTRFKGDKAVNGDQKVVAIHAIQARYKNGHTPNLMAVLGDSPSGDWPMMKHLLKESADEGIVIITGEDVESILERFSVKVKAAIQEGIPNVMERTWMMPYPKTQE